MKYIFVTIALFVCSCQNNLLVDEIVDFDSLNNPRTFNQVLIFNETVSINIPEGWEIIAENDSSVTVDNRQLDQISEYKIFTLSSYELNRKDEDIEFTRGNLLLKIIEDKECCDVIEYGLLGIDESINYSLSIDLEQQKLLGENLLASYLLISEASIGRYYYFLAHTYGVNKVNNQIELFNILYSMSELNEKENPVEFTNLIRR